MNLTKDEVKFMVAHQTLELPSNFPRRLITKSNAFSTLQYVGFEVRDKYPNNIVRLRTGDIFYITKMAHEYVEDEKRPGELKEELELHGVRFHEVNKI